MAVTIQGAVTDGTTNRPSAGDDVALIALEQSMQELAHAKTDANGHFSLPSPDPGMHLIRVDHQGAAYFQPAPPNTPNVNVEVYDVSPSVQGVTTEANVMRMETDPQGLHVTQSFFVKNASSPPRTQYSSHSYEFDLPAGARIEGSAAMGPGGMPVQSSPVPLGTAGRYAFLFPIRPGETQFQISYHLAYSGSFSFATHLSGGADNFVVMLPMSMAFQPKPGNAFQSIDQTPNAKTFLLRNVGPGQAIAFAVSGSGALPRDTQTASNAGQSDANGQTSASSDTRPGGGLGEPIDTPDPLHKYKWWILGAIVLGLAVAAGFVLRSPEQAAPPSGAGLAAARPVNGNSLLAALKDELFAIETDRVQGKLSEAEYGDLKAALELVLRRALGRT